MANPQAAHRLDLVNEQGHAAPPISLTESTSAALLRLQELNREFAGQVASAKRQAHETFLILAVIFVVVATAIVCLLMLNVPTCPSHLESFRIGEVMSMSGC
jgi:hypothetical protein